MRAYVWTFVALLVLTTLTLGLSFVSLGAWGVPVAFGIAGAKAALIALWFMHLKEQGTTLWVSFVVAVLLFGTLLTFAILDVASREEVGPRSRTGVEATDPGAG